MSKSRISVSLDASTADLLKQIAPENASAYIDRLLVRIVREVRDAHSLLVGAEWWPSEILAAMDALNGCWLTGISQGPHFVAAELHDAARIAGLIEKWKLDGDRWEERVASARNPSVALALVTLAEEFWAANGIVERLLYRGHS